MKKRSSLLQKKNIRIYMQQQPVSITLLHPCLPAWDVQIILLGMDKTNKDISSQRNVDGLIFIKTLQLGCALLLIMLLMLILLWNCLVQLTTFRPGTITLFSTDFNYANYSLHFPQQSNGYLMVSSNGGLNQMRAGVSRIIQHFYLVLYCLFN